MPTVCLFPASTLDVQKKMRYFRPQMLPLFLNTHCFLFSAYNACLLAVTRNTAFILLILIPDWTIRICAIRSLVSIF